MAADRRYDGANTSTESGEFLPPDLDEKDKPQNRPIETARQALGIYKTFQRHNRARAEKNKRLEDHYNGEPPFDPKEIQANGEDWRANFATLTLTGIIDRVVPRTANGVHQQKYLTPSKLPSTFDDSEEKSEKFQTRFTSLLRGWNGWNDYLDQLITENTKFGWIASVQMDANDWRPEPFRQEDLLFDENTRPDAAQLQCFCVRKTYFIHELVNILKDTDAAEDAGYNLEGLRNAIERANPKKADFINNPRSISDIVREDNLYTSFQETVKTIETAHVFVRNYEDGTVDQWWINVSSVGASKAPQYNDEESDPVRLAKFEGVAKRMEDVATLFMYQAGNNRLFGSKGLGRLTVNLSIMIDRARMQFIDSVYKSQMLAGQADEADIPNLSLHSRGSIMVVPQGFTPLTQQFQSAAQEFKILEDGLTQLAQSIAGAYLPFENSMSAGAEPPTATEVQIDASREDEINQGIQNRWWTSFTKMVGCIQRRACSVQNVLAAIKYRNAREKAKADEKRLVSKELYEMLSAVAKSETSKAFAKEPDLGLADQQAVEMIVSLMDDNLTPEEILVVAQSPSTEFNSQVGAQEDARLMQFAPLIKDDPQFDQSKLKEMVSIAAIGVDKTKALYIPSPEQTTLIEQQRQQVMEMTSMLGGEPVNVSARDPHAVHFDTLLPKLGTVLQTMHTAPPQAVTDDMLNASGMMVAHAKQHLDALGHQQPEQAKQRQKPMDEALKAQQDLSKRVADARAIQVQQQRQLQQQQMQDALRAQITAEVTPQAPRTGPPGAIHIPPPPKGSGNGANGGSPNLHVHVPPVVPPTPQGPVVPPPQPQPQGPALPS